MTEARPNGPHRIRDLATELLEDAPCGIAVTDAAGTLLLVNRTLARWVGRPQAELASPMRLTSLLTVPGRIYFDAQVAPMLSLQGHVREIAFRLRRPGAEPRPVLLNGVARRNAEGAIARVDWTIFDATERASYEALLRQARSEAEELAAIVRTSPDAIVRVGPDGIVRRWNRGAEQLLGMRAAQARGQPVESSVRLRDCADWFAAHARADAVGGVRFEAAHEPSGAELGILISPIGEAGQGAGTDFSVVFRDITARVQAERRLSLMMAELSHRVKNILSVVGSIARQSLVRTNVEPFLTRLRALGRAQELILRADLDSVGLVQLLEITADEAGGPERLSYEGPPLDLPAKRAMSLSMALHELTTNAIKYGALAAEGGSVRVVWGPIADKPGRIRLTWTERGGAPVTPPERRGFGTRMIEMVFAAEFGAEVRFDFAPEGVCCEIDFAVDPAP